MGNNTDFSDFESRSNLEKFDSECEDSSYLFLLWFPFYIGIWIIKPMSKYKNSSSNTYRMEILHNKKTLSYFWQCFLFLWKWCTSQRGAPWPRNMHAIWSLGSRRRFVL